MHTKYGVGTLAIGAEYRSLAKLLAQDLKLHHPELSFTVLTDSVEDFLDFNNVRAIYHKFGGVRGCYHDKRMVIREMVNFHENCIFLDADCRITGPINFVEFENKESFLVSIFSQNVVSKFKAEKNSNSRFLSLNNDRRRVKLFKKLSKKLNVTFDDTTFVQESFFIIYQKYGNVDKFLNSWELSFYFLTLRLMEFGEGTTIGICALSSGGNVSSIEYIPNWFFKDLYINHNWRNESEIEHFNQLYKQRNNLAANTTKRENKISLLFLYIARYITVIMNKY